MTAPITILDAIEDENLFAPWFKDRATWQAWIAFLAALFALPMKQEQEEIFKQCTNRETAPSGPCREAWLVIGRRGGKSFVLALIAVYLACFRDYRDHLAPGERGTIMVIASDRRQARTIMRYIGGLLAEVAMLARLVERRTAEAFDLTNRVTIEVHTASFRRTRGYTVIAALLDELAFWRSDESAEPDTEVIAALRPAMATIPGAMLLCASSPYARRGALWQAYEKWFGKDDAAALVWQAETRTMNPSVPQRLVEEAYERDPAHAAAEYGAVFRTDVEGFVSREAVMACVVADRRELPPQRRYRYAAFIDPSGGSKDSFTLAIAHREGEREAETVILDLVRERRPPFSPEAVSEEFAETMKRYRVTKAKSDRYAGEWPVEQFRKHGIYLVHSERSKSQLYLDLLPLINSRAIDFLDEPALVSQLVSLERKTSRGGRDLVDHPPGGRDDLINAVAGAAIHAPRYSEERARSTPPRVILGYAHSKRDRIKHTARAHGRRREQHGAGRY